VTQAGNRVLIPPGVAKADLDHRVFTADIAPGPGSCAPAGEAIKVAPRGRGLRVTVQRDALAKRPQGWLGDWAAQAEAQGCVAPGEGLSLATRVLESVPLDPSAAPRLLNANSSHSGYVEVRSYQRLQVVIPVQRAGTAPEAPLVDTVGVSGSGASLTVEVKSTPNLLGYETAWYAVRPKAGGYGSSISLVSVDRVINGAPEPASQPSADYFRFSSGAAFFRLFYKTDEASGKTTEMVLAAADAAELDQLTKAVDAQTGMCARLAGESCAAIPQRSAVNSFLEVTVNGKALALPGGSVASAIRAAGESDPARALPTLEVSRLYGGRPTAVRFDRNSRDILELTLMGGETISW
jgi:hypothetical protein